MDDGLDPRKAEQHLFGALCRWIAVVGSADIALERFIMRQPAREFRDTLSFNSSLMREMRAIAFITRMIDKGFDDDGRMKKVFMHCIDAEQELRTLGVSSKVNVE